MKTLHITGPARSGKSTAIRAVFQSLKPGGPNGGVRFITVERGKTAQARADVKEYRGGTLAVDIQGSPSAVLLQYIEQTAAANGVKYLILAHA